MIVTVKRKIDGVEVFRLAALKAPFNKGYYINSLWSFYSFYNRLGKQVYCRPDFKINKWGAIFFPRGIIEFGIIGDPQNQFIMELP